MADTAIIRSIGGFVAEVTTKEQHRDDMTITSHPVERGAATTDHAFKMPAQLNIVAGWSAAFESNSDGGSLSDLYADLLDMQASAQPLEVQTGKRLYKNMLIRSLAVETDVATENVLMVTAQLQEIILVDTIQTSMPPAENRATPEATAGVADTGKKSLQPVGDVDLGTDGG